MVERKEEENGEKKNTVWNDTQCRILSCVSTPADSRKKKGKIVNIATMWTVCLLVFLDARTEREPDNHLNGFIVVDTKTLTKKSEKKK